MCRFCIGFLSVLYMFCVDCPQNVHTQGHKSTWSLADIKLKSVQNISQTHSTSIHKLFFGSSHFGSSFVSVACFVVPSLLSVWLLQLVVVVVQRLLLVFFVGFVVFCVWCRDDKRHTDLAAPSVRPNQCDRAPPRSRDASGAAIQTDQYLCRDNAQCINLCAMVLAIFSRL